MHLEKRYQKNEGIMKSEGKGEGGEFWGVDQFFKFSTEKSRGM